MPHITTAMEWSRRRGIGELIVDGFVRKRSVTSEATSVKDSFSSWSNCMAATYCKWPVIAVIIVGGLIVFSIVWCIIRCTCMGMSCCCSCFSCLKCCQCCAPCCEGKKGSRKMNDEHYFPPQQGYRAPEPMMGGGLAHAPKFASFDVGKNGLAVDSSQKLSDDALPPMPSWETANNKHVLEEEKNAMELGELDPVTGQKMPLMNGGSNPVSPAVEQGNSPYGARPGQGMNNGYMGAGGNNAYGHSQNNLPGGRSPNPGMVNDPLMGYRGTPPPMGDPGMGYRGTPPPMGDPVAGYRGTPPLRGGPSPGPGGMGPNRGPGPYRNGPSPGPGRGGFRPQQDQYPPALPQEFPSNNGFHDTPVTGYGQSEPNYNNNNNRPFPPQPSRQYSGDSFSRPMNAPTRQYSNNSYQSQEPDNTYRAPPPRGPSRGPGLPNGPGPNRMMSPAPPNNGNNFAQQGYSSRSPPPQQQRYQGNAYSDNGGDYSSPAPMTRSPPPQEPVAYPGYKPYTPVSR